MSLEQEIANKFVFDLEQDLEKFKATFRNEVHVVSPILRPDGSRNAYTIPRHAVQHDCFAVNHAAITSMASSVPVREGRPFDDGWEGY